MITRTLAVLCSQEVATLKTVWYIHLRLTGCRKGDEHLTYTSVWTMVSFTIHVFMLNALFSASGS